MAIASLNTADVLRITSGQVIIDLRAIIKELVENSIDAGSTNIDITFYNYGLDSIAITDNGHGIDQQYFDNICLRGYTSKITEFNDLEHLRSLGFRGEALNSICLVSSTVKISTSTAQDYPLVSEIEFGNDGRLLTCNKRKGGMTENGTMVVVTEIFSNLPVRHKTLIQNLKREFHKAINLLINYLIAYPEIRFIISNVTNKRNVVMNSRGGKNALILDNMTNIFGANGSRGLGPITLHTSTGTSLDGFISSSSYGYGRSSPNRQFLFINKRPVISKKLQKIINDVFKQFNYLQYPVFALNIAIDPGHLDVNIVPDKTCVLIHNEPEFLDEIRVLLTDYYTEQENTVPKNFFKESVVFQEFVGENSLDSSAQRASSDAGNGPALESVEPRPPLASTSNLRVYELGSNTGNEIDLQVESNFSRPNSKLKDSQNHVEPSGSAPLDDVQKNDRARVCSNTLEMSKQLNLANMESSPALQPETSSRETAENVDEIDCEAGTSALEFNLSSRPTGRQSSLNDCVGVSKSQSSELPLYCNDSDNLNDPIGDLPGTIASQTDPQATENGKQPSREPSQVILSENNYGKNFFPAGDEPLNSDPDTVIIGGHHQDIRLSKRIRSCELVHDQNQTLCTDDWRSRFLQQSVSVKNEPKAVKSNIHETFGNVDDLRASERQEEMLTCTIKKRDFLKLRIIGQFNLGFILVTFNEHDMFIIDQHASDEKINFEELNRRFQVDCQRLVIPKVIELSSIDELLVISNASVFQRNGFLIEIDQEKPCGQKIRLLSLPVLKSNSFSIHDFHELVDKVEHTSESCQDGIRCSKIESILASRACRSSIMIGQHLQRSTMARILQDLSSLEKPWNCPHGRPTMRHLMSINQGKSTEFDRDVQIS